MKKIRVTETRPDGGCTQIYFAAGEPALHYDDREGLAGMMAAIVRAQERCYEIMAVSE